MSKSNIEWTERTWNPIVGCSIVSPGCINCYAMKMASRIQKMNRTGGSGSNYVNHYDGTTKSVNGNVVWTGKLAMAPDKLFLQPLSRKAPTTYFVNSMGDLFHEDCPDEWIIRVFAVMALSQRHTYQVLTKRAERMQRIVTMLGKSIKPIEAAARSMGWTLTFEGKGLVPWPLPNVWLGVSTEDQRRADERIPLLLQTPAAIRFISAEPLLGPINLTNLGDVTFSLNAFTGEAKHLLGMRDSTAGKLNWVIVGGESGPGVRPMHPAWPRELRDQCTDAGIPFFFKQWGSFVPEQTMPIAAGARDIPAGTIVGESDSVLKDIAYAGYGRSVTLLRRRSKRDAGRSLDGIEYNAMPVCHP